MGMTMTQKILAAHAGLEKVEAGQLINARLDEVLGNDITTPVAINEFEKAGFDSVFDNTRINIVLDHFVPNKDIKAAQQSKQCRDFANKYGIVNFFDVGEMGIERPASGKRHRHRRRLHHRRRQPYLHLRSCGSVFHRRRQHGHGSGNGYGPVLV